MSRISLYDIVFENRNKEYGAYAIRKEYLRNALIGLASSLILAVIFSIYFIFDSFVISDSFNFSPEMMKFAEYNIDEELLKATQLDPVKENIVKNQPIIPKNINEEKTLAEDLKVASGMNFVDSVAIRDSITEIEKNKKKQEEEEFVIDSLPRFAGSTDAFRNYLVSQIPYPDTAYVRAMKGKLMISFIIKENGEPDGIKLDNFADTRWGRSIFFAIKRAPRWQPAYRNGKPVKMYYSIPVYFAQ